MAFSKVFSFDCPVRNAGSCEREDSAKTRNGLDRPEVNQQNPASLRRVAMNVGQVFNLPSTKTRLIEE